ncbi:Glycosyltransferase involved in cell wall bisynthesis [Allopseudospirillum japonicum]|uniref:Glycosyltransferase involved in cell wall bisynthesis n=1 Tax=Allopseudospirillum japonicum TaxID=64971 RepID=A0A1H6R5W4_9GAMM|nr:glycosyltransferase family 4 protein [Allopseudospirillum japonicum]SEI46582.1 Glycosyltransferase involved in cell wall bisynthesis [Allopseudospirillum japonicum]
MRIAIANTQVPFEQGGAEILAQELCQAFKTRGHEAEIVTLPFKWYPSEQLLDQMQAASLLDLTSANGREIDRVITLKFPLWLVQHPHKTAWVLHQHRQAYDLYAGPYSDLHTNAQGQAIAHEIWRRDRQALQAHQGLFAIAETVAQRLWRYNQLSAQVLYPPPQNQTDFYCEPAQKYVLAPGRMDPLKRQELLLQAWQQGAPKDWQLIFIGPDTSAYGQACKAWVQAQGLTDKIHFLGRVSEQEKLKLYAQAGLVYNGVYDEDYGYVTIEAMLASKSVFIFADAGGPLEFVQAGITGRICAQADVETLAQALADLDLQQLTQEGLAGRAHIETFNLNWSYIVDTLLAT